LKNIMCLAEVKWAEIWTQNQQIRQFISWLLYLLNPTGPEGFVEGNSYSLGKVISPRQNDVSLNLLTRQREEATQTTKLEQKCWTSISLRTKLFASGYWISRCKFSVPFRSRKKLGYIDDYVGVGHQDDKVNTLILKKSLEKNFYM